MVAGVIAAASLPLSKVSAADTLTDTAVTNPELENLRMVIGQTSPKEIWENRDEWLKVVKASRAYWATLPDDKRKLVVEKVGAGLLQLLLVAPEWIPDGLEAVSGNYCDVYCKIIFTDAEVEERNYGRQT